jgi:predicted nucleic acid-binding protein
VTYLIDTSALLRILRKEVDPAWRDVARRGLIMLCEPVIAETLVSVDAKRYTAFEEELRETYPYATVPDAIWDLSAVIRRELVPHSPTKDSAWPTLSSSHGDPFEAEASA